MKKKYLDFKKIYYKLTLLGFVCLLMAFAPKNNENIVRLALFVLDSCFCNEAKLKINEIRTKLYKIY